MTMKMALYFVLLTAFFSITAHAAEDRDLIVQKQLDCVDDQLQHSGSISWSDVCEITDPSPQEHMEAVTQQLDQMQADPQPQASAPAIKKSEWVYSLAPQLSNITYREPAVRVKETGDLYGIFGAMTYRPDPGNPLNSEISDVYRVEGMFDYGKVNYHGGYSDGTPLTFDGINDYLIEARGFIGKDFDLNNRSTLLTPYFGFGYRSLFDAFSAEKAGGYNRWIQYFYIPAGGEVLQRLNDHWTIGVDLEYDFLIQGNVTSYLGEVYSPPPFPPYADVKNVQKHGFGFRSSVKIIRKWNRINLVLEPYLRYWHIRNSEVNASEPFNWDGKEWVRTGYYEPNNNSVEIGTRLGIEF